MIGPMRASQPLILGVLDDAAGALQLCQCLPRIVIAFQRVQLDAYALLWTELRARHDLQFFVKVLQLT